MRREKSEIKLLMSFLASGVVQLTTLPIVLWLYGEVSMLGIFLNLLVLPTVGIVLGSGTAGALLGLVTVRGAFLAVVPGRIILRGYEFLTVLLGATFVLYMDRRKAGSVADRWILVWFWQQRCGCTERV